MARKSTVLKGISDIRRYFHRSETPVFFVSATSFNLLGMDEWVRNFHFVNYIDCFDGQHPNTFVPSQLPHAEFQSIEAIDNYLLQHPEVLDYMHSFGPRPKTVFLMFDETTERLARKAGLKVWFPPAKLRHRVDDKVETVRIGNQASVPSVPNVLARVGSYRELRARSVDLGHDLVIQTAYGDSGHTTFYISSEQDWKRHAAEIAGAGEVKIMKRIRCRQSAIEACVTRVGTLVGPLMTELVGFPQLTPYRGGWCGNEIFAESFTPEHRRQAHDWSFKFGEQLRQEGYRSYFELDFLIDQDSGEMYLGELNPRVTGASSMTNHAAFAHADAPLFLFHLLEFSGVDFKLDVDEINARWAEPDNIDQWSQLVLKHTASSFDRIVEAPRSGIWQLQPDGSVEYARFDYHRRAVRSESEGLFLRIAGPGDWRYEGADLGILITRGRLMTNRFTLNRRARQWIAGLQACFRGQRDAAPESASAIGNFKLL